MHHVISATNMLSSFFHESSSNGRNQWLGGYLLASLCAGCCMHWGLHR